MNKNYIFGLTAIVIAIVLVIAFSSMSATLTLDQIIKNRDCSALDKWENDHMFDDNLNISSEQMSGAMKLATECVGKALNNMLGNSGSSTDTTDPMVVLDEILKKRDCEGLDEWGSDHRVNNKDVTLNSKQVLDIRELIIECNSSEIDNFLKESDLSTDTTDPMVVLGKILNKKDCEGMESWSNEYRESDIYKYMSTVIRMIVLDFQYKECKIN